MRELIEGITNLELTKLMMNTREKLAQGDPIYIKQEKIVEEIEKKYKTIELSVEKKEIIEKYIEEIRTLEQQYADISYISGMRDMITFLNRLGLLNAN
ncbi:MAG: hypothetical protein ACI4F9_07990 [Lachnospiraceae bacterium]